MHIPVALHRDTRDLERPRGALVLPAAVFPLLVIVLPFATTGAIFGLPWGWWLGGFGVALAWAVASGFVARSPKPWMSLLRLLGWSLLWCVEPFVVLVVLGPVAQAGEAGAWIGGALYIGGASAFGYWLFRHHRVPR
ncbi:hypothetical protein [Lentzea jiangxiensis]|uniref:Uncharacterized protein n=1 Tax=Lentzea jiangxiensis TaxID=641025 RepID=A0A1H0GHU5_9PSEU|nr:hypothetical protein [Lentzea jiangxiensis]SDO06497.1 hypothetical protein SAMN05421507_1011216 [Lentzea jiangxiensis]